MQALWQTQDIVRTRRDRRGSQWTVIGIYQTFFKVGFLGIFFSDNTRQSSHKKRLKITIFTW